MKYIKLTQGKVAIVDDEDYEWLNQWKWYAAKGRRTYYALRNIKKDNKTTTIKMHRVVMGITESDILIDHKDHDGLNNQKNNLRIATVTENQINKKKPKSISSSKYQGVSKKGNRWVVVLTVNKKQKYVGKFKNEIDAAVAYNKAAIENYGEFAVINDIK